jgi:hypothetical protein
MLYEPVTIRRNRLDLQNNPDYKDEVSELSTVEDPQEKLYELTPEQSKFYDRVIQDFSQTPRKAEDSRVPFIAPLNMKKV